MARIELTQGLFSTVDDADAEWLGRFKWRPLRTRHGDYVSTDSGGRVVLMHRLIMAPPKGLVVDHINHDGLDNRRANLRVCTQQENLRWRRPQCGKSSRFKGVSRYTGSRTSPWQTKITIAHKVYHVGVFSDEVAAAQAYDAVAREHFGQFAYLNFPADPIAEYRAHHPLAKRGSK